MWVVQVTRSLGEYQETAVRLATDDIYYSKIHKRVLNTRIVQGSMDGISASAKSPSPALRGSFESSPMSSDSETSDRGLLRADVWDVDAYARQFEQAMTLAWENYVAGQPPRHIYTSSM
mmetsp:Transcript_38211/g.46096  ORF Transcript_38211/g.46096 Transcript_38211/m.46096 type:complete len:119 (-) Transcript_38211:5-361(-)